jgi:hypothetical protein
VSVLITGALASLIFGLSYGQQHGFDALVTIGAVLAAAVLGVGFLWVEKSVAHPMLPFCIFALPTRRSAVAAMILIGAVLAGYVYFVSLYLQKVLGFSPLETGLSLVPSTLAAASKGRCVFGANLRRPNCRSRSW